MGSWGHFENRSKAVLGNKKARFHLRSLAFALQPCDEIISHKLDYNQFKRKDKSWENH